LSLKVKDTDVGLKRYNGSGHVFFQSSCFSPYPPPPLSLRRKGVHYEQREERKNDEERDKKGVMIAGGVGDLEPNKTTAETRGHLAIFLSVATANSTPYLVCLLP
jgi:hypothetical protein